MARGPFIKWEQVIRDLVGLLGVNTPTKTRREEIASAIGIKTHALDKLIRQLRAINALEIEAIAGPMRAPKPGGKPTPVRTQQYTITKSADDILFLGKKRNIKWGQDVPNAEPLPGGRKIEQVPASKMDAVSPPSPPSPKPEPPPPPPAPDAPPKAPPKPIHEEQNESPFAVLRPLKRDEAAALIETAHQYKERRSFIDEKVKEFAEHGLTLDPAVLGFPTDERLEHIALIADYVFRLQRENERLQDYANRGAKDEADDRELHLRIQRQENEIGRMVRERAEQMQAVTDMSNRWSGKEATYKQRIQTLEQQVRDLMNKYGVKSASPNGAAATAVK